MMEVVIALMLVGLLASFAIPSYQEHVRKARRTEATRTLLDLASQMERYYADQETYTGATVAELLGGDQTENGHYTMSIPALAAESYTLQAAPTSSSQSDDKCGSFSLTSANAKGVTGDGQTAADCW